eukprot:5859769-Prorocentrum_lima.AAC.1
MGLLTPEFDNARCTYARTPLTFEIRILPPGARNVHAIQLEKAPSGYLLIPCTSYTKMSHHRGR